MISNLNKSIGRFNINEFNVTSKTNITEHSIENEDDQTFHLPYYYNDIDRNKCESILRLMNRPGCFLIRRHKDNLSPSAIQSPYVLSIVDPSLKVLHYLLYRINQRLFIKPYSDEFYNSVKDLVHAHQRNPGVLPCTLAEYPVRVLENNDDLSSSTHTISKSSSTSSLMIQTNKIIRQDIIGRGHFGVVYKGLYNNEIPVAIKTFTVSATVDADECESNVLREARTMMYLRHPYLVHLYGVCRFDDKLCLVTDYVSNGCLLFWLQQQKQKQQDICTINHLCRRLLLFSEQVCDAMAYLEVKLIVHRDLAARNCLIDDGENIVKVSDFGMARHVSSSTAHIYEGKCETPFPLRWSSPEVLLHRKYSSKSDIWSYGVLLWEIYSLGEIPFGENTTNELVIQYIKSGRMLSKPDLADQFIYKELITTCWMYEPINRPSFSYLKDVFDKKL